MDANASRNWKTLSCGRSKRYTENTFIHWCFANRAQRIPPSPPKLIDSKEVPIRKLLRLQSVSTLLQGRSRKQAGFHELRSRFSCHSLPHGVTRGVRFQLCPDRVGLFQNARSRRAKRTNEAVGSQCISACWRSTRSPPTGTDARGRDPGPSERLALEPPANFDSVVPWVHPLKE
jgi:hypothetical protein